MELPKNKTALAVGVVAAGIVTTAALAMAVWPALTRPDPPAEAAGEGGLSIRVVEPPKASVARTGRLDVGLSEAAQAMTMSPEALTPTFRPAPPQAPAPARHAPPTAAQADEDDIAPPEPSYDRRERDHDESGYELSQQRWEDERQARRDREERAAWEEAQRDRQRWEESRERDRYDDRRDGDRYEPPPQDDSPPPERW